MQSFIDYLCKCSDIITEYALNNRLDRWWDDGDNWKAFKALRRLTSIEVKKTKIVACNHINNS